MRKLTNITAETLLSVTTPEALFSQSSKDARQEYKQLAARWHPDHERLPLATKVFDHICKLYRQAKQKLADGSWDEPYHKVEDEEPGLKTFKLSDGVSLRSIQYICARSFELGTTYIGDHTVCFEVKEEFADLFQNGLKQINHLHFADEFMAVEMSRCLPQVLAVFKTASARLLVLRKTPDQLLLKDVLDHFGGAIQPELHIGWILNVLWNLSCYLEWARLTHNAICTETFFVSPLRRSGMLLGGWWYSAPAGTPLIAVPDRLLRFVPAYVLSSKCASTSTDRELIKAIGRELLGDSTEPGILVDWLQLPAGQSGRDDYSHWKDEVIKRCFAWPRYVEMALESKHIYKEK